MVTGVVLTETRLIAMPGSRPDRVLDWEVT